MPMLYQIQVEGKLKESWSEWFNGMTLSFMVEDDGLPVTTMLGPVADQSALHGLLNRIRDLGLPLLYLTRVESAKQRSMERVASGEDSEAER